MSTSDEACALEKDFDALEMKRRGQELLRQRLAGMSRDEQLAYWARRYREITERQQAERDAQKRTA